jgi:hypothetical protein
MHRCGLVMDREAPWAPSLGELPADVISRVLAFLDGTSLLAASQVSNTFNQLTDQRSLWEAAVWLAHPHLRETRDASAYTDDYKALLRDRNRRNRSAVFEWIVEDFVNNPELRYSDAFTIANFSFQVGTVSPTKVEVTSLTGQNPLRTALLVMLFLTTLWVGSLLNRR